MPTRFKINQSSNTQAVTGLAKLESKLGDYATVKMAKRTGLIFLAWHGGYWTKWHVASRDDLTKLKCEDSPGKKDQVQTSDRVKFEDICNNCLMNLGRELVK